MLRPYVALDSETTGLEAGRDELIEVAAVRFQGPEILGTWHSLIKPAQELPEAITELTGITPQDLQGAPTFHTVLPDLARFIGDDPLVGHAVPFDVEFLAAQGLRLNNPQVDTWELSTLLLPELPDHSLQGVAQGLGLTSPEPHRALADAHMARQVLLAFWQRLLAQDLALLEEIVRQSQKAAWALGPFFEEVYRAAGREGFGRQPPSAQPLAQRMVNPEPRPPALEERETARPLDTHALANLLAPEGLFAQAFPHYEHRPQQVHMLQAVTETMQHGGQLIVEAGTGTGKSMAYLIPAAALAVRRGQHVVISTNTINLQDQLFYKDLPDLQRVLAQDPGSAWAELSMLQPALLKGRGNYLCLRRWEILRRNPALTPAQVSTLVKTLLWLPRTSSGDRAELGLVGAEYAVWNELAAASGACQGAECPYQQQDRCFFYRARRRAEAAHVIVINHSLLLSDVATESRVLPTYEHLVIDEAHNLESVTTDQLGFHVTQDELLNHLASISRPLAGGREEGLLALLPVLFQQKGIPPAARETMQALCREMRGSVSSARVATQTFFSALQDFIRQYEEGQNGSSQYDRHWRLSSSIRMQPDWTDIEIAWEAVSEELVRTYERLARLHQLCQELAEKELFPDEDALLEITLLGQRTIEIQKQVTAIVSEGEHNNIYWISIAAQAGTLGLHVAPLHVGELLREGLYQHKESLVLTSATLSIEGSTDFMRERLGLPEAEELLLDSPFDFPQAALLLLPGDMPDPRDAQYGRALSHILIQSCRASQGRTLVLFTSHYALRQTYQAVRRALQQDDIAVLGQGLDGSRHVLLEKFRRNPRSVLLGTRSFWEGIDVVGEGLSVLVIAKLPFDVPSDPIFAARCELFEQPFYQYAIPQTVLRFKQGFGRLIRSKTDRGVVIMLDARLLKRSYGPIFLNSLPACSVRQVRLLAIPQMVRDWLQQKSGPQKS
ncbi:MAG: DNA polymerase III subunit epsilon [Chloroflexia bacterium]|nr:DNA polymerase III subunit epsilon [Chloroflexia bacterium]